MSRLKPGVSRLKGPFKFLKTSVQTCEVIRRRICMISSSYPQKVINPALLFLQVRVLISLQRSQFEQRQLGLRMDGETPDVNHTSHHWDITATRCLCGCGATRDAGHTSGHLPGWLCVSRAGPGPSSQSRRMRSPFGPSLWTKGC